MDAPQQKADQGSGQDVSTFTIDRTGYSAIKFINTSGLTVIPTKKP